METYQHILAGFCAIGLLACAATLSAVVFGRSLLDALNRAHPHARAAFLAAACLATLFGGAKHMTGRITYPRTDPETWYLMNNGSFVTNDHVHVSFTRNIIVPASASFYLDGLELRYTNESDWAEHSFTAYTTNFANMTLPIDIPFAAATNYNWIAYTDWVPPPVVHTNGVAFVVWQIGKATNDLAMTRTGVYRDDLRMAPNPAITNGPPIDINQLSTLNSQPSTLNSQPSTETP